MFCLEDWGPGPPAPLLGYATACQMFISKNHDFLLLSEVIYFYITNLRKDPASYKKGNRSYLRVTSLFAHFKV